MGGATSGARWTTRGLLAWIGDALASSGVESGRLCAEMLVSHVIGCDRLKLYTDADRPATPLELSTLRGLVGRALKHEPVQYLVGECWFFGMSMVVDKRVLIPRPSTETVVDQVLGTVRAEPGFGGKTGEGLVIADVCTGSGCIAVVLAKQLKGARVVATDISAGALEVARENAMRHGVEDRVECVEGDLLDALHAHGLCGGGTGGVGVGGLDVLVSNPPYVSDAEWAEVAENVKGFEPEGALRGGVDGLEFVRRVLEGARGCVREGGLVVVEVASSHAGEAAEIARGSGLGGVRVEKDYEGLDRVVVGRV